VFASQKGGSGKTTLSGHLAVAALRADHGPVAVIDTDPQGSLLAWAKARGQTFIAAVKPSGDPLAEEVARLRAQGARLVIIDTPPAANANIVEAIRVASLVVVPTRPSPHDLRAVGSTVDIVEACSKPMVFVVNSATPRAKITADAAVALSQHGTVAPVTLHHRVDYAASMIDGRTVMEVSDDGRSAQEVTQLWQYVEDRLARQHEKWAEELSQRPGLSHDMAMRSSARRRALAGVSPRRSGADVDRRQSAGAAAWPRQLQHPDRRHDPARIGSCPGALRRGAHLPGATPAGQGGGAREAACRGAAGRTTGTVTAGHRRAGGRAGARQRADAEAPPRDDGPARSGAPLAPARRLELPQAIVAADLRRRARSLSRSASEQHSGQLRLHEGAHGCEHEVSRSRPVRGLAARGIPTPATAGGQLPGF
jgi:chromosome partitioning protein